MEYISIIYMATILTAMSVLIYRIRMKYRHNDDPHDKSNDISGELIVTGRGDVDIEERLPRSRMLEVRPLEVVHVCFKEIDPPLPSCTPHHHDKLEWYLRLRPCCPYHTSQSGHRPHEYFVLHIRWRVFSERTIVWSVKGA